MTVLRFGTCELDLQSGELRRDGGAVRMEPLAFDLLAYMASNAGRILDKEELNENVWDGRIVSDTALSTCIKAVRKAIGDDGKRQGLIKTVHGRGFRFVANIAPTGGGQPTKLRAEKPVIAVAPFVNLSGDPGEDWFADGLTSDIIGALTRHRWLSIIARNSMMHFKGQDAPVADIRSATGADYVVAGNVSKHADRVRVRVELVDSRSETCLWSERYDRDFSDIFEVQDAITQAVASRLEPAIGSEERKRVAAAVGARDLQAWEEFHLGMGHFFKFTQADNAAAQELLDRARTRDPDFGDAHAWWAYAVVLGTVYWDTRPSEDALSAALEATGHALSCDGENAIFHALKARVQLARREYDDAIEGNRVAIELNPTLAAAYCGLGDSFTYLGEYPKAIEQFEQAIAMSNNDPQRWAFYTYGALACIFNEDYDTAVQWCERAAHIPNHQYWTYAHKAVALAYLGEHDRAQVALAQARQMEPRLDEEFARERLYYLRDETQLATYLEGLGRAATGV